MSLLRLLTSGGGTASTAGFAGSPGAPWAATQGAPPARGSGRGRSFDSARSQRCSLTAFEAPELPHLRRTRSLC